MNLSIRYLLLYVALMAAIALTPFWREADWRVFGALNHTNAPAWPPQWLIIDVPYVDTSDNPTRFREQMAAVLSRLAETSRPRLVVIDVYFSSDSRGLPLVDAALAKLRAAGVPTYAAINPLDTSGNLDPKFMDAHAASVYHTRLDGFGHTQFEFGGHTLKYDPYLLLSKSLAVPALAITVAEQQFGRPIVGSTVPLIVNVGSTKTVAMNTVHAVRSANGSVAFSGAQGVVDLAGKNVLIGSLDKDRSPYAGRSGPELLAWALIERTGGADTVSAQRPLTNGWVLLGLMIVIPALSVAANFRLRRLSFIARYGPWGGTAAAITLGLALIALWVALTFLLGHVYPRVTLVAISVIAANLVTGLAARQLALRRALEVQVTADPDGQTANYDVFISYSRTPENAQWVMKHVFEPLRKFRDERGRPLRIFFDTQSIKTGSSWYATLVESINSSRHFVAIYSADYFDKKFCRFEMERAAIKRVHQSDFIVPILREPVTVPGEFDHIQHIDARTNPDFITVVLAQIQREHSEAGSVSH